MPVRAMFLALLVVTLLCSPSLAAETPRQDAANQDGANNVRLENVAMIKAGNSTREQIRELLGTPYRMTNYGDCNPIDYQEFWEYVGHDANGVFKIHIEFDDAGIARIIAKDNKKGPIIVLDSAPRPEKQHHHSGSGE